MPLALQFASLYVAAKHLLVDVDESMVGEWEKQWHLFLFNFNKPILHGLERSAGRGVTEAIPSDLLALLDECAERFASGVWPVLQEQHQKQQLQQQQQQAKQSPRSTPKLSGS